MLDQPEHGMRYEPLGFGAGTLLGGRYDIVRKLGAGGMSAVYRVLDRELNNEALALKLFSPQLTNSETLLERFRNEVLITRKLTHPNIVRTFEFADAGGGHYFMTMELTHGVSLDQLVLGGSHIPLQDVLRILSEILEGIAHAHEIGVVHRDLKPGNVLISKEGQIKITDFGLAKTIEISERFTQTGECVGTPYYMAPEQIRGESVDARADLYAIGVIAYELVTGEVPFHDKTWYSLATKIVEDPVPQFATKKNRVPPWFEEFVLKATAKDKEERFQSAQEMIDVVAEHLSSEENWSATQFASPNYTRLNLETCKHDPSGWMDPSRFFTISPRMFIFALLAFGLLVLIGLPLKKSEEITTTVKDSKNLIKRGDTLINKATGVVGKIDQIMNVVIKHEKEIGEFLDKHGNAEEPVPQKTAAAGISVEGVDVTPVGPVDDSPSAPVN